jgi:hypothetical protein
VMILNKLLKILDARNYQNAGNAVLEYATSTRDLRRIGFVFGHCDPWREVLVGTSTKLDLLFEEF